MLTLWPATLIAAYFVGGFVVFCVRSLLWGVPRDPEIESRGRSVLVGYFLRNYIVWLMRPLWRLLLASGVSANAVTTVAALLGLSAGVAVALGLFALGGWLFILSGLLDLMDGRLARARHQVTATGMAIDSILDRYTDYAVLIGLAWYYRESWVLLPVLAAMMGTSLVPYVRAKAESMGIPLRDGLMQRAERILYLGAPIALSPLVEALHPHHPHPVHRLAAGGVVFIAVASNLTALGRFWRLLRALSAARPAAADNNNNNAEGPRPRSVGAVPPPHPMRLRKTG
jgi:phosphatidylglycerophosphate synthase